MNTPVDADRPVEPSAAEVGVPAWRRERRQRTRLPGPLYRAGYINSLLAGRLDDGRELALVAGTHSRNYPFHHPHSKFDDVLLVVGDESFVVSARQVSSLGMSLGPRDAASIFFHGRASTTRGAAVQLDFNFNLFAHVYPVRPQGIGTRYALLGLLWQPAVVVGTGSVTIHDRRYHVRHVAGEMERGTLTNLRGRMFEFGYDYLAVCRNGDAPAAYVQFETYSLHPGVAGLAARLALRYSPSHESITLLANTVESGDTRSLRNGIEGAEVLIASKNNLGPATIHRELLRLSGTDGTRYGLRECFVRNSK